MTLSVPATSTSSESFFSILLDHIPRDRPLDCDIFVNSSGVSGHAKFVRVFPRQELFDLKIYLHLKKYPALYVSESQRLNYLAALVGNPQVGAIEKVECLKSSAISYLSELFASHENQQKNILIADVIAHSHQVVQMMLSVVRTHSFQEIYALIAQLSFHDFYTFDHSVNVALYSMMLLREVKGELTPEVDLLSIGLGGLLHDLGKLDVPTQILNNPGKLSDEEYAEIKKHPLRGKELLVGELPKLQQDPHLAVLKWSAIAAIILEHHENVNGSGYPFGKKKFELALDSKVVAVADFFDAITTRRSYSAALALDEAVNIMAASVDKKIDPLIFAALKEALKHFALFGKQTQMLPEDFDPSQPHSELPLLPIQREAAVQSFGAIKGDLNLFGKKKS